MTIRIERCSTCGEQTGMYESGRIGSIAANKCRCPASRDTPRPQDEETYPGIVAHVVGSPTPTPAAQLTNPSTIAGNVNNPGLDFDQARRATPTEEPTDE